MEGRARFAFQFIIYLMVKDHLTIYIFAVLFLDGAVIDCYPSAPHTVVQNRFKHNTELMVALHKKKLLEENDKMAKHIGEQKSQYALDAMQKDYEETRRM